MRSVPPPKVEESDEFRMLVSNADWSDYVGRIGGKVLFGSVKIGDPIWRLQDGSRPEKGKVSKVFEYSALATNDAAEGVAGNIVGIAGSRNWISEKPWQAPRIPRPCLSWKSILPL